jgi:hypothetical protein
LTDIIKDSVKKIESLLEQSGCEEIGVDLDVNPDVVNCQFEKGACMTASFGGRSADFVTFDPVRARTKISFMFDATLDTPATRGVATVIVNAATGFFCLSRILHACPAAAHSPCREQLKMEIGGKRIFCIGNMTEIEQLFSGLVVPTPDTADIILINGDGIIARETGDRIENFRGNKRILCVGSSVAGVARLQRIEHWCPFGQSSPSR